MNARNITVNPGGGWGRACAPGRTISSASATRPALWSFFLSRAVNLERSQSPWGFVAATWAEPPAPSLAAAPVDPDGRGFTGGFPAAPVAVELEVPFVAPFFTIVAWSEEEIDSSWAQEAAAAMARMVGATV